MPLPWLEPNFFEERRSKHKKDKNNNNNKNNNNKMTSDTESLHDPKRKYYAHG